MTPFFAKIAAKGILVGLVGLLLACNESILKEPPEEARPPSQYKLGELTYANVHDRVFRPSCVACHSAGGGVALDSYTAVKAELAGIRRTVFVERRMPKAPNPPLSGEQLGLLNAWIQAGAPETSIEAPPPPAATPLEPSFASIKYHILEPKCLSCHAPGKPVERIPLVTREDLLESPLELVLPGNPEESGLIIAVTSDDPEKVMPPPKDTQGNPTGFAPLSLSERRALEDWIRDGAKD